MLKEVSAQTAHLAAEEAFVTTDGDVGMEGEVPFIACNVAAELDGGKPWACNVFAM